MSQQQIKEEEERDKIEKKKKPKTVKCPKCENIVETVVKEECNCYIFLFLLVPFLFVFYLLSQIRTNGKYMFVRIVHRCPRCNHDCTKVEKYKEGCGCNIF